ncbi:hypothetical protein ONZ45_g5211 [Pleurotus djamor]|nr:hypothetical protein ONZ45_g5211 [Pleurotus djamor]
MRTRHSQSQTGDSNPLVMLHDPFPLQFHVPDPAAYDVYIFVVEDTLGSVMDQAAEIAEDTPFSDASQCTERCICGFLWGPINRPIPCSLVKQACVCAS